METVGTQLKVKTRSFTGGTEKNYDKAGEILTRANPEYQAETIPLDRTLQDLFYKELQRVYTKQ
jgi:hypothetical protein